VVSAGLRLREVPLEEEELRAWCLRVLTREEALRLSLWSGSTVRRQAVPPPSESGSEEAEASQESLW